MRVYKFNGEYGKLKEFGYNKFNILSEMSGIQLWGKLTEDGSIVIGSFVSVKPVWAMNEPALTKPQDVKPFIQDLIHAGLVTIKEQN